MNPIKENENVKSQAVSPKIYLTVGIVFLVLLGVLGILIFALPDRTFSENENRQLAGKPEFSFSALSEGTWQEQLDQYLGDQFPGRELLISASSSAQAVAGIRDVGGAYLGKNHRYFEIVRAVDLSGKQVETNFAFVERFAEQYPEIPVTMLLAPDAGVVLSEELPSFADYYSPEPYEELLEQTLSAAEICRIRPAFLEAAARGENLYYKTDHHWTTHGAYLAYAEFCKTVGTKPRAEAEFALRQVTDSFLGTLYSKTLSPDAVPDRIEVPVIPDTVTVTASDGGQGSESKEISVLDVTALEKKDQYLIFFGGNYGKTVIRNSAVTNGKSLLIVKDSYANSFVPFLLEEYETIVMLDLRYLEGTVSDVMAEENFTRILFLYQFSSFAKGNFVKLRS